MNPTVAIELALEGLKVALSLIAELKAQSGMTDAQLLDFASAKDLATRNAIAAHIASVKAQA